MGEPDWLHRVGPVATLRLRRYERLTMLGAGVIVVLIAGVLLIGLSHRGTGFGVAVFPVLLVVVIIFVIAMRSFVSAQYEAVRYCGLPADARKWVPLRSSGDFDQWMAKRGTPGWPKHWKSFQSGTR